MLTCGSSLALDFVTFDSLLTMDALADTICNRASQGTLAVLVYDLFTVGETLKNDPISLFPPLESVIFDLAARFNPFLGSFWVF